LCPKKRNCYKLVKYYERRDILKPHSKKESGFRLYSKDDVKTIKFIKHAQELGFKLEEIKELINLRVSTSGRPEKVRKKAGEKLTDVQEKIKMLKNIEKTLKKLVSDCKSNRTSSGCPIIEGIERSL